MTPSRPLLAGFIALSSLGGALLPASVAQAAEEVRVLVAPPPLRVEVPPFRPSPYHVWQAGTWVWQPDHHYGWHPGRWVVPPPGRPLWVKDEWVNYGGSWHYAPGHWAAIGEVIVPAAQRIIVSTAPPPDQVETFQPPPVGQAWVPGHWSWSGREYAWVPGHYMLVPEGHATWVPGHWYANGGKYFYQNGYWR